MSTKPASPVTSKGGAGASASTGTSPPAASAALQAKINENNTELTAQIANAISLTNTISGMNPGSATPAAATAAAAATTGLLANLESLLALPPGVAPTPATLAAMAPVGAPALAAVPATAPGVAGAPADLGLLSQWQSFLSPSDLAVNGSDPSVFLPTPFAPGQNASTISRTQQPAPAAPMPASLAPVAAPGMAPLSASAPQAALQQQQALLRQLAAATAYGPTPAALAPAALLNPSFAVSLGGLAAPAPHALAGLPPAALAATGLRSLPPGTDLSLLAAAGLAPAPTSLAPGFSGFLPGLGQAALTPAALAGLAPGLANPLAAGGLNLSGLTGLGALRHGQNSNSTAVTDSRDSSSTSSPQMPDPAALQGQIDDGKGSKKKKSKKRASAGAGGRDPLIKSREARWIIRYNELLEFRREHGHCRVPHGYAPNRKLSWWVMNQRAQYAHRGQGKKTWLTDDRIQLLDDIGFIWTPHLKRGEGGGGGSNSGGSKRSSGVEKEKDKSSAAV